MSKIKSAQSEIRSILIASQQLSTCSREQTSGAGSHALTCTHMHSHALTCTHMHSHALTYTHMHSHALTCTHIHSHTLTYTHIHSHTLTCTHMHARPTGYVDKAKRSLDDNTKRESNVIMCFIYLQSKWLFAAILMFRILNIAQ